MKRKWFEKDMEKLMTALGETRNILSALRDTQEEKLENYPEKFVDTPNYQLSEERLAKLTEMEETMDTLLSLLDEFQ